MGGIEESERNRKAIVRTNIIAGAILVLGLFQIVGDTIGVPALKGIGAASAIAPFPKVFSDVNGLETFASTFTLQCYLKDGAPWERVINAELYQKLRGPYNRRNVYGAALSYAPRLPEKLWTAVFCYGLRPGGPLRKEFEISDDLGTIVVVIKTNTRNRNDSWTLSPQCD